MWILTTDSMMIKTKLLDMICVETGHSDWDYGKTLIIGKGRMFSNETTRGIILGRYNSRERANSILRYLGKAYESGEALCEMPKDDINIDKSSVSATTQKQQLWINISPMIQFLDSYVGKEKPDRRKFVDGFTDLYNKILVDYGASRAILPLTLPMINECLTKYKIGYVIEFHTDRWEVKKIKDDEE